MSYYKMILWILVLGITCRQTLGRVLTVENTEPDEGPTPSPPHPCPCKDQPEGIMMPHTDCRAYYTCMGSSNVRYSRCGAGDQFFHPYLRSCVQRSKYLFFVPNIVETKDLCKINSVFRAPEAENFDNCHIVSDDDEHTAADSDSGEDHFTNQVMDDLFSSSVPNVERVGFPWLAKNSTESGSNNLTVTTTTTVATTTAIPTTTTPTTPAPKPGPVDCKMAKVLIHHFPGPCTVDITCESGASFTLNNCLNTLTFISKFTPAGTSN